MNEEKIKELLSVSFVRLLAERAGYVVTKPSEDFGDDLYVKRLDIVSKLAGLQYFTTGDLIGLQIKCITQKRMKLNDGAFTFDLTERAYNHLIYRKQAWMKNKKIPLILIVVVLSDDPSNWLNYYENRESLELNAKGFWYAPSTEAVVSNNKATQRISISTKNKVILNLIDELFHVFHPKIIQ